ncbi:MAG: DEAD/DEAH box helicase family protein [Gorillibacterium sp.]|nr:DEAD/DEAH box helicase family protein [Gorillibacterium sp.]
MRATLYAIRIEGVWHWRATLAFEIDQAYWYESGISDIQIVRFVRELSWGQAMNLKELFIHQGVEAPEIGLNGQLEKSSFEWREIINAICTVSLEQDTDILWVQETIEGNGKQLFLEARTVLNDPEVGHIAELIRGRSLFRDELLSLFAAYDIKGAVHWTTWIQAGAMQGLLRIGCGVEVVERNKRGSAKRATTWRCNRCGSGNEAMRFLNCPYCNGPCPYCECCLGMGRSRSCSPLIEGCTELQQISGAGQNAPKTAKRSLLQSLFRVNTSQKPIATTVKSLLDVQLTERFGLNQAQSDASHAALAFLRGEGREEASVRRFQSFLIWAVTGAGKTEMIFPLIEHEVRLGRNVLIATPRRDVVLELLPRMSKAFPNSMIIALYGGSEQRWEQGEITLATTHQLIRFRSRFDMVVIDELDAFPYHNNPMLKYAAEKSVKPGGRCIYLSATPPLAMQQQVKKGRLPCAKVPVRFHQQPLPIPWLLRTQPLAKWLHAGRLPRKLKQLMDRSLSRGAQLFLFVPQIKWVPLLVALLEESYPGIGVGGTSSQDEERIDKVSSFRQKAIRILVTTTILERGVTIAKADVFVLDASAELFDEAALVQMAGRAGRSKDDPAGFVVFAAAELTRAQTGAVSQIRRMNRLAKRKGYFTASE